MKITLIFLFGLFCFYAQGQNTCFVLSVQGTVTKQNNIVLKRGDTIYYDGLSTLKFIGEKSFVVIIGNQTGTLKLTKPFTEKNNPLLFDKLKEMFVMKANLVKLSTRGSCECVNFFNCFQTDTSINNQILIIDSIALPSGAFDNSDKVQYFLQWIYEGKSRNNFLHANQEGQVYIKKEDLIFNGIDYLANGGEIAIGALRYVNGAKKWELMTKLRFSYITSEEILAQFKLYETQYKEINDELLLEDFCKHLYINYGKPNACKVKEILKSK